MRETDRHVAAAMAALDIIDAFNGVEELRINDLFVRTGFARSRILRLIGTLDAAGYLSFDEERGVCRLGPKIFRLGWMVRRPLDSLLLSLQPRLELLSDRTGATTFFSIAHGRERQVIAKAQPSDAIAFTVTEGSLRPIHVGATGAVLLAYSSPQRQAAVLSSELERVTSDTLTDPQALEQRLQQVRDNGFAISDGEGTPGLLAISVPVLAPRSTLIGALSLAAPSAQFAGRQEQLTDALIDEASTLSRRLPSIPLSG